MKSTDLQQEGVHALLSPAKNQKPVVLTPLGADLSPEEAELYSQHKPYGFILFGKHCQNQTQLRKLISDLRAAAGDDCIISVDQEGGRVARMREPHWSNFPAAAHMDDVYKNYFNIGKMLKAEGFNVNYAPCLDVIPVKEEADAIGDRCFSSSPSICGHKGIEACQGLLNAGITPVIKHMPGHGRAKEDSHFHLPVVSASESDLLKDIESFKITANSNLDIAGMTCHVIYKCWDPEKPATLSSKIIQNIIRKEIGFKGLLFSDDLIMKALDQYGDMIHRVHASLDAGCDIAVPCHTNLLQSKEILESL